MVHEKHTFLFMYASTVFHLHYISILYIEHPHLLILLSLTSFFLADFLTHLLLKASLISRMMLFFLYFQLISSFVMFVYCPYSIYIYLKSSTDVSQYCNE